MKVEKKAHLVYKEWKMAKEKYKEMKLPLLIGRWHYIYSSDKGKISLIQLMPVIYDKCDMWEIFALEGELFEDVERYPTKKEAVKRIKELIG